jgi:hypothetical protein
MLLFASKTIMTVDRLSNSCFYVSLCVLPIFSTLIIDSSLYNPLNNMDKISIEILDISTESIRFALSGCDVSLANALRRIMIS